MSQQSLSPLPAVVTEKHFIPSNCRPVIISKPLRAQVRCKKISLPRKQLEDNSAICVAVAVVDSTCIVLSPKFIETVVVDVLGIANETHQRFAVTFLENFLSGVEAPAVSGMANEFYRRATFLGDSLIKQRQRHFFTLIFFFPHKLWKLAIYNASELDSMSTWIYDASPYV